MKKILHEFSYLHIVLIVIEAVQREIIDDEKGYIIDNDKCIITL